MANAAGINKKSLGNCKSIEFLNKTISLNTATKAVNQKSLFPLKLSLKIKKEKISGKKEYITIADEKISL